MQSTSRKIGAAFVKAAASATLALCTLASSPSLAADSACVVENTWFSGKTVPEPDNDGFKADAENCAFHKWSWQAFLWLTEKVEDGRLRFETFPGPESLLPLTPKGGPGAMEPMLNLTDQAGPDGILVDHNGRAVYYSMHVNDVFSGFFEKNKLTSASSMAALDPNAVFPNGSLSLKAAWKIVGPGESTDSFYTRRATINKLKKQGSGIAVDKARSETVTVALVGLHVVGTVEHHKEMIWASFEHKRNAPDLSVAPTAVDFEKAAKPDTPVSGQDFTFYKANTPYKDCNLNPVGTANLLLDEETQRISPVTQVCRIYAYGSGPDKGQNAENIKSLNSSVQDAIAKQGQSVVDPVWQHYFEVGSTWFKNGASLQPDCNFQPGARRCGAVVTGSTHLSNAVIETFTQSQSTMDSCFSCHNTMQRLSTDASSNSLPGKNANISHIFNNLYFDLQKK